jgi:hypothetical protein
MINAIDDLLLQALYLVIQHVLTAHFLVPFVPIFVRGSIIFMVLDIKYYID